MTVSVSHNAAGLLRVYINGTLHLAFSAATMAGLQSWKMSTRDPSLFAIEITPAAGEPILCEYDDRMLWQDVLAAIDLALWQAPKAEAPRTPDLSPATGAAP